MKKNERPIAPNPPVELSWGSDVAAAMMRHVGIEYVALNPGASYRGLHDSLVNYLGNEAPKMLLCLHEDHVVSIAHGYAKVTDRAMGAVLHSNVGLMHGLMGIFNAYCDRMPMLVVGATGPVAADLRRPWIDWIHTAKDQGALLRDYIKWDDEPRSAEALVEAFLRGAQLTHMEPRAPIYICLDAGLQEEKLSKPVTLPPDRYELAPPPSADQATVDRVADLLLGAKKPLLLFGRGSRAMDAWDNRVQLAERLNAQVMTSLRERAIFPTMHRLHPLPSVYWLNPSAKALVSEADVIVSLDWADFNGFLQQVRRRTADIDATIVHASMDSHIHRGWSMDYFGLPPADIPVQASADRFVEQLLEAVEAKIAAGASPASEAPKAPRPAPRLDYTAKPGDELAPRDIEVALAKLRGDRKLTLAHLTIGWAGDVYPFDHPLDFLGHDGGAGLAAGPGNTVGAALALKDNERLVVSVLGDGDFMQGCTALWTAAHYEIPALFIVSNNRSNFNDEIHQETVAKARNRPPENRWIGQRIDEPALDLAGLAQAQGVSAEGPIRDHAALEAAILRGFDEVEAGRPYLIDVHVAAGYANSPLSRGE